MPPEQPETVEVTTDTGKVVDAVAEQVIEQVAGVDPAEGESQQADVVIDTATGDQSNAVYAANAKDFVATNSKGDRLYGRIEDGQQTYLSTEPRPGAIYPE